MSMKTENIELDEQSGMVTENGRPARSFVERDEHSKFTKDQMMTQSICLFRKYLFTKPQQHGIGKTNMQESEAIRMSSLRSILPPKVWLNVPRPASFLEQQLLPGTSCDATQAASFSSNPKSSMEQLTIFYSGTVNVYDNITVDKAQAIMLLAGQYSSSTTVDAATKVSKTNVEKPIQKPNLPSFCKLQAEIPLARKRSIQEFLKKRRERITSRCPYASSITRSEDDEGGADDGRNNGNRTFTPSPFPSRLGFFFPRSANKCS